MLIDPNRQPQATSMKLCSLVSNNIAFDQL